MQDYLSCYDRVGLLDALDKATAWAVSLDDCIDIFSSCSTDNGTGIISLSLHGTSRVGHWSMTISVNFNLGDEVFRYAELVRKRLTLAGKAVSGVTDHVPHYTTHLLTREHGTMAGTGAVAYRDYLLAATDAEATIMAMKFGGTLRAL